MYLRHSTVRKNGKVHTYWRLVRSVRRGTRVTQETVAQLGELDAKGRLKARSLALRMTGRSEQGELFAEQKPCSESVRVCLEGIRVERQRRFGDVWVGWTLWRALGLDGLLRDLLPMGREAVEWATVAAILVIARLCEPSSELHIAEQWYRTTALDDVLGVPEEQINDDRLYRALDHVLPHKDAIERHLHRRLGELFELEYDLLLYDVTSTYFEGLCEKNGQAKRGHSRDHRSDCKQVVIAMVVTREGMPLSYEVFEGNRVDVTTVQQIVEGMEARFGLARRIWVMDRGMTSTKNLAWLKNTGRRFVMGTPRTELRRFSEFFAKAEGWTELRDGVEVRLCPQGDETFVLCRSADRKAKESAMHDRFGARIEEGLRRLESRLSKARRPCAAGSIERQIGRLLQRNSRGTARFKVEVVPDASRPAGLRVQWHQPKEWEEIERTQGAYILRSNVNDWSAEQLWQTYIQLTQAEAAFRIQKSDLGLRPVWHQRRERVDAHLFVCFLAYVLWKTLEQWQQRAGLGNSPRLILDEAAHLHSADVVLPIDEPGAREIRLRCVVRPAKAQALLFDRLGLRIPERLRPHEARAKM